MITLEFENGLGAVYLVNDSIRRVFRIHYALAMLGNSNAMHVAAWNAQSKVQDSAEPTRDLGAEYSESSARLAYIYLDSARAAEEIEEDYRRDDLIRIRLVGGQPDGSVNGYITLFHKGNGESAGEFSVSFPSNEEIFGEHDLVLPTVRHLLGPTPAGVPKEKVTVFGVLTFEYLPEMDGRMVAARSHLPPENHLYGLGDGPADELEFDSGDLTWMSNVFSMAAPMIDATWSAHDEADSAMTQPGDDND